MLGEAAASSNGGAASASEVVAVGASDAFDDAKLAQTGELSGEGCGRALGEQRPEVGTAQTGDIEGGTLEGGEQALFDAAEKIEAVEFAPFDATRLGEPIECADTGREIVQTGEVFEITAVATEQDFTQVDQAVDRLLEGGEGAGCRALPMFHLAVVLESGDVVGGRLQAQDDTEFVIDLDRGFAETMPDAGSLDPRCELTTDLLGELGSDPVAEEGGECSALTVRMACRDSC